MNRKYANDKEQTGYEKLLDFNQLLRLTNLQQTVEGDYRDATGITKDNKKVNIENKVRNQTLFYNDGKPYISGLTSSNNPYSADTIYIEAHKAADLLVDWITLDFIPLFVNYLNDNFVVVFNLSKLKQRPKSRHLRIYSSLYQSYEEADRLELSLQDAFIYKKDENNKYSYQK